MFASGFDFHLPPAKARLRQDELRSRDIMLLRMRQDGGRIDEELDRPRTAKASEWSRIRFVLDGPLHVRGVGADLELGDAHASADFRIETGRALTRSSDWLDLYWRNGGPVGDRLAEHAVLRLSPGAFAEVVALARVLERRNVNEARPRVARVLTVLRSAGIAVRPEALAEQRTEDVGPAAGLASVLWRLLSGLSTQPMAVDLARNLGLSEKQALRKANRHIDAFHLGVTSWRDCLTTLRLEMGAFFMSSSLARLEDVSRFLGFASPTGFCHALHAGGLPSPLAIQRELQR